MSSPDTDFFKQFEEKKKKIKILILGPYSPVGYSDKMVDIKNDLASKGYRNAKLVKDFPDNPAFHDDKTVHIIEKSQYYIKYWADALVFVFFKNASN